MTHRKTKFIYPYVKKLYTNNIQNPTLRSTDVAERLEGRNHAPFTAENRTICVYRSFAFIYFTLRYVTVTLATFSLASHPNSLR